MAAAAVAAAMAERATFTIVYPKLQEKYAANGGSGSKQGSKKSNLRTSGSSMESSPLPIVHNNGETKPKPFTRRQSEYINSSRIPTLNRRNSLFMPELEPFEPAHKAVAVAASEHSPAAARQQRLSSIISNDDETEAGESMYYFLRK